MGKLITLAGNSAAGKTTLAKLLSVAGGFELLPEDNLGRPFQKRFDEDLKAFALANQIDFLLFRAEQEIFARDHDVMAVQDGGLDQDFHVFTKRFYQSGYLSEDEYDLCTRLYGRLRECISGPDVIVHLGAPVAVLAERMTSRGREIDIAKQGDLDALEALLDEWLAQVDEGRVIRIDAGVDDASYTGVVDGLAREVRAALGLE